MSRGLGVVVTFELSYYTSNILKALARITMASSLPDLATNFVKLKRFEGVNFRCWQTKIHVLLITLKVAYVLSTLPILEQENEIVDQMGMSYVIS